MGMPDLDSTSSDWEEVGFESFVQLLTYCYLLPIICIVGVVGNAANLSTLATPKLSAVSYTFLRALAVADLACMLSTFAFCVIQILKSAVNWPEVPASFLLPPLSLS